ncbi:MAG: nicotinamide riboside transporter PnuC, partial [Cytophagales bacterium]|nr:nicotinamide riboside transporter PnuC [Cytophagales bacterium]
RNSELGTQNSELGTQNSELRTRNSELGTQNSELRTQNSELRTQNSELRTRNSELRTQNSELRTMKINYLELISASMSLTAVFLKTRQKVLTWPVGLIGIITGFFVYYEAKLYAKCLLNIIYCLLAIYGWYQWLYGGKNKTPLKVSKTNFQTFVVILTIGLLSTLSLGHILATYTDAELVYGDAFHTSFSPLAAWMTARKKLESWILWIDLDIFYLGVCYYKGLCFFSISHGIYLILAGYGYIRWRKSYLSQAVQ